MAEPVTDVQSMAIKGIYSKNHRKFRSILKPAVKKYKKPGK